jgi:hypothetical protein
MSSPRSSFRRPQSGVATFLAGVGFAAFLLVRRSVLAGVLAGEAALILGAFWFAG